MSSPILIRKKSGENKIKASNCSWKLLFSVEFCFWKLQCQGTDFNITFQETEFSLNNAFKIQSIHRFFLSTFDATVPLCEFMITGLVSWDDIWIMTVLDVHL